MPPFESLVQNFESQEHGRGYSEMAQWCARQRWGQERTDEGGTSDSW